MPMQTPPAPPSSGKRHRAEFGASSAEVDMGCDEHDAAAAQAAALLASSDEEEDGDAALFGEEAGSAEQPVTLADSD